MRCGIRRSIHHGADGEAGVAVLVVHGLDLLAVEADGAGVVVVAVGGGPVVAVDAEVADHGAFALAGGGQEDGAGGLHLGPLVEGVGVGAAVVVGLAAIEAGLEGEAGGEDEVVGQDDHAVDGADGGGAELGIGVGAAAEQVLPLGGGEGAPEVGLVAAVGDGVVPSPVGLGIGAGEGIGEGAAGVVVGEEGADAPGLVGRGAAVPAAGAPAEEVDPLAVGLPRASY